MKIAIIGTRGIPNNYGGFEQVTEWLSEGLVEKGHDVSVYSPHHHPYQNNTWRNVQIRHCYEPDKLKTVSQFIYDFNCIMDARRQEYDVIVFMGYTSSSIWHRFFPKNAVIVSNMDGLEWKRSKYSKPVQQFLKYAEKLAVRHSHFHIADAPGIRDYYRHKYNINCRYIPYAASCAFTELPAIHERYSVKKNNYYMLMARMEPENNIDLVLDGFTDTDTEADFLVVGNHRCRYGKYLMSKYREDSRIKFTGAIFDQDAVHTLRKHALIYFHGHSVGGTNPSLLEAMASKAVIAAHDNEFNRAVLENDAFSFSTPDDIPAILQNFLKYDHLKMKERNALKISYIYNQQSVIDQYEDFLLECFEKKKNEKLVYHQGYAYK